MDIVVFLVSGLAALILGGELLIRGAVKVAEQLGLSPLLIGLTLVGFGTSAPELVTSVQAALAGSPGIALGNVIGSNIANCLLIGGTAALLCPIVVETRALKRDGGVMVVACLLLAGVAVIGELSRLTGAIFVGMLVAYLYAAYRLEKERPANGHGAFYDKAEALETALPHRGPRTGQSIAPVLGWVALAVAGLAVVIGGGRLFVEGAVLLARTLGVSETVIGLTVVAIGTSMPELVTSILAAIRRQSDLAIGNIFGSNIYNILGIAGVTGLIAPIPFPPETIRFDIPVMVGVAVLLCFLAFTGRRICRTEGAVLLLGYGLYLAALWPGG